MHTYGGSDWDARHAAHHAARAFIQSPCNAGEQAARALRRAGWAYILITIIRAVMAPSSAYVPGAATATPSAHSAWPNTRPTRLPRRSEGMNMPA